MKKNTLNLILILLSFVFFQACVTPGGEPSPTPQPGDTEITTVAVFVNLIFNNPVAMVQAPGDDTRWFVVEQAGRVLVFENTPSVSAASVFIDITNRVINGGEAGLLGIAFHPDFASNGQVFLSYTGLNFGLQSRISRFTSSDGGLTLNPASETVLLTLAQPFSNHNGGHILFGPAPNHYLFIGFGDGGSGNDPRNNAQNTENIFGTILRIDVDGGTPYAIPPDNPFASNTTCAGGCPEIYAWGLRNPWRFSFDRVTGELWAGDVGQNAWEEIDIVTLGGNYGWRIREGAHCNNVYDPNCSGDGLIDPVTEYGFDNSQSVTGGYVYRGNDIAGLIGIYIYGDYIHGTIFQYFDDGQGNIVDDVLLDTNFFISSFAEANDGELFLLDYSTGTIHQIVEAQ
ncbi:MAG: PQQ-dependent sugar dehydrogenase [bacterium]|nr:PQQ-dependent sugar dehydrogenase [bacterium]